MTPTTYLAILGRQPQLGLVELESLLGADNITLFGDNSTLLRVRPPFERLGGVIKLGEVLYQGPKVALADLALDWTQLLRSGGKTSFGLSFYGSGESPRSVMAAGLELKKKLRQVGSVRLVAPTTGSELSAAQVQHNRLTSDGFELLIAMVGGQMVVARTEVVQDIDWYSRRDYDRPARSAKVGMLPPKLAQVLVNTTHAPVVLDPFCGTGVVLQEAVLAGREGLGSDLAPEMVAASRQNLAWLEANAPGPIGAWLVADPADARTLRLPKEAVAIASEGYLGENQTSLPSPTQLQELETELGSLYREALGNWAGQLSPGAEVSICVPSWRTAKGWHDLNLVDDLAKLGYTMKVFKSVPQIIRYARNDQIVGRQLYLLTRT